MSRLMHPGRRQEEGFAVLAAVVLTIVITLIIGVIAADQLGLAQSSSRHSQRTSSLDAAEGGVQAIQQALHSQRQVQGDGFTITEADIHAAANIVGTGVSPATVMSNGASRYKVVDATGLDLTVREPAAEDGFSNMWQVLQVMPPQPGSQWLTIYVRGWRESAAGGTTQPAVIRARMRPGSIADYQLVSDSPVQLDPGITINGRIHSNGWQDETVQPPASNRKLRIWATGTASCVTTAGIVPTVSTARGHIELPASGCRLKDGTNQYIPLNTGKLSFDRMRSKCGAGSSGVSCFLSSASVPSTARARVQLSGSSMTISTASGGSQVVSVPANSSRALLFNRSVEVRGTIQGRVTIATWNGEQAGIEAPDVVITGDVGRVTPSASSANSLGLLAEHDIVVDHSAGSGCNPRRIDAALLAATGGVVIPWQSRTLTMTATPSPQCGNLAITGSIASHTPVALRWSWGNDAWTGFGSRRYSWDSWLSIYPPPYWPMAHPWELIDVSAASGDCFVAGRAVSSTNRTGQPECR